MYTNIIDTYRETCALSSLLCDLCVLLSGIYYFMNDYNGDDGFLSDVLHSHNHN